MSTRGAFGFHINNQDKVTYKHMDSYPDNLGREILDFINNSTIQNLSQIAQDVILVNNNDKPSKYQIEICKQWSILSVTNESSPDWYCLLRKAQGKLEPYTKGLNYMMDSSASLLDSLYCEYAYIINIDDSTLEFYCGFVKKPYKNKGRYANQASQSSHGFYGVVLVEKYPLENIIRATSDQLDSIVEDMENKVSQFQEDALSTTIFA